MPFFSNPGCPPWTIHKHRSHWEVAYAFDGDRDQTDRAWADVKLEYNYATVGYHPFRFIHRILFAAVDEVDSTNSAEGPGSLPLQPNAHASKRSANAADLQECLRFSDAADRALKVSVAKAIKARQDTKRVLDEKLEQLANFKP